jgi:hypothetical protein
MNDHFNYLGLDAMQKLKFRDNILRLYLPYFTIESLYSTLERDRDEYIADQNYEIAQAYQDLINDLRLLDNLVD